MSIDLLRIYAVALAIVYIYIQQKLLRRLILCKYNSDCINVRSAVPWKRIEPKIHFLGGGGGNMVYIKMSLRKTIYVYVLSG